MNIFEGIVLGAVIWFVVRKIKKNKNMADGTILGSYIMGYGLIRFILEYFRQPDSDIGYVIGHSNNIYLFESFSNISNTPIKSKSKDIEKAILSILRKFGKLSVAHLMAFAPSLERTVQKTSRM